MNKELIDKTWSVLPKEFKEDVKKIYKCKDNTLEQKVLMQILFGGHNLTSDAEGEEMLYVNRKRVQEAYNISKKIVEEESYDSKMYSMHTQIMCVLENLFGSKCLPDEKKKSKCEICGASTIICAHLDCQNYKEDSKGKTAEPQEKTDHIKQDHEMVDRLIKDDFRDMRRLNIAKDFAAVLLGRLNYDPFTAQINCCCSNGEVVNPYSNIAGIALSVADALIAEYEKGDAKSRVR